MLVRRNNMGVAAHEYLHQGKDDPRWRVFVTPHPKYKTGWCVWAREHTYNSRHHVSREQANSGSKIMRYSSLEDAQIGAAWLWRQMPGMLEALDAEHARAQLAADRGGLRPLAELWADIEE
jgi:hypothetical protein